MASSSECCSIMPQKLLYSAIIETEASSSEQCGCRMWHVIKKIEFTNNNSCYLKVYSSECSLVVGNIIAICLYEFPNMFPDMFV